MLFEVKGDGDGTGDARLDVGTGVFEGYWKVEPTAFRYADDENGPFLEVWEDSGCLWNADSQLVSVRK